MHVISVRARFELRSLLFFLYADLFVSLGLHQEMWLGTQRVREVLRFHSLLKISFFVRRINHVNDWTHAHIPP